MIPFYFLTKLAVITVLQRSCSTKEVEKIRDLKLALVVYRHGDRSPFFTYPTDPHGEAVWPEGFGQLTSRGLRQHFKLGKFLRKRYELLLDPKKGTNQIYIQSSGMARTLKSAAANAAGLLPPTKNAAWDADGLGTMWQPIPIFSHSIDRDAIFSITYCKTWGDLKNSLDHVPEMAELRRRYTPLMHYLVNHTGLTAFIFPRTFNSVHDVLYAQSQNGHLLPAWATSEVQREIQDVANIYFHMALGGNDRVNTIRPRLRGGNMMRVIMEELTRRVNGSSVHEDVKLFLYSAHDESIAALLSGLQLYDYDLDKNLISGAPNYAACLIFELFQNNTVRISYKNEKPDEPEQSPEVLKHPNCTTFCAVTDLVRLTTPYFMTEIEWFEACKLPVFVQSPVNQTAAVRNGHSHIPNWLKMGLGISIVLSVILMTTLITLLAIRSLQRNRRRKRREEAEVGARLIHQQK